MHKSVTYGNFTFVESDIQDVVIVDCRVYGDDRGAFMETYKRSDFVKGGITADFVQDNQSMSRRNVLRGLHFQIAHPQAKLSGSGREWSSLGRTIVSSSSRGALPTAST